LARNASVNIEVRLFASLRQKLPPGSSRTSVHLDLRAGSSILDVLNRLDIPPARAFLVLVDGKYEADKQRPLVEGNVLSIWPPIAGG
jgi:molybdopterin converting factor small subunit